MKDIAKDLEDRLALLHVRWEVAFWAFTNRPDFAGMAAVLEHGLHDGDETCVKMVQAIVDPADMDSAEFWGTPLGVLLFAAGGYPRDMVPQSVVVSLLRCSRQYVHELIVSKKLLSVATPVGSTVTRMVDAKGVQALVKKKIDKLVK